MSKPIALTALLLALALALAIGANRLASTQGIPAATIQTTLTNIGVDSEVRTQKTNRQGSSDYAKNISELNTSPTRDQSWSDETAIELDSMLKQGRLISAIQFIDTVYQQATADDLERFKSIVFIHGLRLRSEEKLDSSIQLFGEYAKRFDDTDAWIHLGNVAAAAKQWEVTVKAYLKSSINEHDPLAYQDSLRALVGAASQLRSELEKQGDQLGILDLYKRLYEHHPNFARFQLELAQSYLRLKDLVNAKPLLQSLRFDPEFGSIAEQKFNLILEREKEQLSPAPIENDSNSDIVIPLVRAGNSFLLDLQINSQDERLLLDTGASITSLSRSLIDQYNLPATGQSIRLNTANGTRISPLFTVQEMRIGPLRLRNLLVAEITLSKNSIVQGLAGTDLLNQISTQHDYIIDNQKSALIFKQK